MISKKDHKEKVWKKYIKNYRISQGVWDRGLLCIFLKGS